VPIRDATNSVPTIIVSLASLRVKISFMGIRGGKQYQRKLRRTPQGKYYVAHIDLETPGDGAPIGCDMTKDEVYFKFRQEGLTDQEITAALKAADDAASSSN
jgi:hypothetical protein